VHCTPLSVDLDDAVHRGEASLEGGPLLAHDDGHELLEHRASALVGFGAHLVHEWRLHVLEGALEEVARLLRAGEIELAGDAAERVALHA